MSSPDFEADFLDRLYAVAMEPERFSELAEIWVEKLSAVEDSSADLRLELDKLESHIRRAEALLKLSTTQTGLMPDPLKERLQAEPHAVIAIDEASQVAEQNDAALQLYGDLKGHSARSLPFEDETRSIIAGELKRLAEDPTYDPSPQLLRCWRSDTDEACILTLGGWTTASARRLLLIKTVHFSWPERLTPLFRSAFGLTEAEMSVTRQLVEGKTVAQVADDRNASVATIRSQVRAIYGKMAVRNQTEFMRMTLGLTTLGAAERRDLTGAFEIPETETQPPHPRPDERRILTLPDGRHMDYAEFGAPDGEPCLYLHNEFFGDGFTAAAVSYAQAKGLRILAPARAHYGRSSRYPKGVSSTTQFSDDLIAFLDHLGIDKVAVFTQPMAPTLFAISFLARHPKRCKGAVMIAPLAPFPTSFGNKKLFSFQRLIYSIAQNHPRMLEFLSRSGMAFHNRVGSRSFFKVFAEGNPVDLKLVEDDVIFAAMVNGARLVSDYGHESYFNDYLNLPSDMEDRLLSSELPVHFIIGETVPNDAIANVRAYVEAKANFDEVIAQGGGQYAFFSHPELMFDTVETVLRAG